MLRIELNDKSPAELIEIIDELQEELRIIKAKMFATNVFLPPEWKLTAQEETVFKALLGMSDARPVAPKERVLMALDDASGQGDYMVDQKIVDVLICKIRKKLAPFGVDITTHWGRGYSVDSATRRAYDVAIKPSTCPSTS